ncbi:MAG: hypothetical protein WD623_02700 [Marinobacter sp.]|uniref:hypothetical protein n=1 Tax=Marinobacter sp. TaxID=50741 RepID=UPI0034A022BC
MKPDLKLVQTNHDVRVLNSDSVHKLSASLGLALRIQSGKQLVFCLGTGTERSNDEALVTWVHSQLLHHGLSPTRQALAFLIVELEKALNRWEMDL